MSPHRRAVHRAALQRRVQLAQRIRDRAEPGSTRWHAWHAVTDTLHQRLKAYQ